MNNECSTDIDFCNDMLMAPRSPPLPRLLIMDEFHRVLSQANIQASISSSFRSGRKFNSTPLAASQHIGDFSADFYLRPHTKALKPIPLPARSPHSEDEDLFLAIDFLRPPFLKKKFVVFLDELDTIPAISL